MFIRSLQAALKKLNMCTLFLGIRGTNIDLGTSNMIDELCDPSESFYIHHAALCCYPRHNIFSQADHAGGHGIARLFHRHIDLLPTITNIIQLGLDCWQVFDR